MVTRVGDQNLLMMYCHIAHDCIVGNRNVVANGATLGGHVVIEDFVIVGGLVGIHQFVRIGTGAILGAGSMVSKDVPPYCNATGDRAKLHGLNIEGLKRRGFDQDRDRRDAQSLSHCLSIDAQDRRRPGKNSRKNCRRFPKSKNLFPSSPQSERGVCR